MKIENGTLIEVKKEDVKTLKNNPDEFWKEVTDIGCAFSGNKSLEEIFIPEGITFLQAKAFENCINLKKVVLPEGLKIIDSMAFVNCSSLEEITIPESVVYMGRDVFYGCEKLKTITFKSDKKIVEDFEVLLEHFDLKTVESKNGEKIYEVNFDRNKDAENE